MTRSAETGEEEPTLLVFPDTSFAEGLMILFGCCAGWLEHLFSDGNKFVSALASGPFECNVKAVLDLVRLHCSEKRYSSRYILYRFQ